MKLSPDSVGDKVPSSLISCQIGVNSAAEVMETGKPVYAFAAFIALP